jgi:tripartite ATP-independent transporter DctM subunit
MQGATTKASETVPLLHGNRLFAAVESALAIVVELLAASLVVIEAIVLFAGVVARYVFHRPLTWSDEIAIILFLWLSMLGSAVALRRGAHMRLTLVVEQLPLKWRSIADATGLLVAIAFLVALTIPSIQYTVDVRMDITPALRLPNSFRAAAVVVGVIVMIVTLMRQLTERSTAKDIAWAAAILAILGLGCFAGIPLFARMGSYNLVIFFLVLLPIFILLGLPIAFAFGFSSVLFLSVATDIPLTIVVNRMDEGMSDIILLSIPLFIFLGELIVATGMARAMIFFLKALLRPVRNGLAYVLILGMYLVSGISGSKSADMAAVAPVLFPEMKREGADEGDLVALLSASGAMAETIPPSIILIAIGAATGVSIAELFTGGLLPAAVGALALLGVVYFRSLYTTVPTSRIVPKEVMFTFVVALPGLLLPLMIRGAVVNGVATATEVATIGITYCVFCGVFVYRQFPVRRLYGMLLNTASLSAAILLIIGTATVMAWALTQSGFSEFLGIAMTGVPGGRFGFLAVSIVVFAVLGSVLEGFPAIILLGPLLFPIAKSFGVDGVQYAMVAILSMSLGLFAPPLGVGYYAACAIGQVSPDHAFNRIWVYLGALLGAVILIAAVPWISTGFLAR